MTDAATPLQRATQAFERAHGRLPALAARAPGRVNLIGEHTDYNDGFVLPCAIDFHTVVVGTPRQDGQVRVLAVDQQDAVDHFALQAPITPRADAAWANYPRGMLQQLLARGLPAGGADLVVAGNVPLGAGLSSSAALNVAVGEFFRQAFEMPQSPTDIALAAQAAENQFVGCQCGVMDPLVSALGRAGHALLLDCRSLQALSVPLPADMALLIVHSRVRRGLVGSEYNTRRAQCEAAARHFGVAALRELPLSALESAEARTLDPTARRRARHVITENQRTLEAAAALAAGDLRRMGVLMAQSHLSMRDDFEITVPAVDRLVALLQQAIGPEGGARMTGGGFGGCVVALLPRAALAQAQAAVAAHYRSPDGECATLWCCSASDGAARLAPGARDGRGPATPRS